MFNLSCERPHHFEVSLCKWQLAWCQQTATVRVTIILPSSAVVWNQHLPHTAVCCRGEVVQDKYNTAAPLYSSFLANKLNMRKVYQQYVLYMAGVAMTVSMATRFTRACNLIRYVVDIPDQVCQLQQARKTTRGRQCGMDGTSTTS